MHFIEEEGYYADYAVKADVACLQVKLCDPHLNALEVRFSRRGAIQIYVYLYLYLYIVIEKVHLKSCSFHKMLELSMYSTKELKLQGSVPYPRHPTSGLHIFP